LKKVSARRRTGFAHSLTARHHALVVDEPEDQGGSDSGPTPQELLALSLASCTAITLEMYADRKGWDVGKLVVDVDYPSGENGAVARFDVFVKVPAELTNDQLESLRGIARKCPVHRVLVGDVEISDRLERVAG
jgi:putative redox protein